MKVEWTIFNQELIKLKISVAKYTLRYWNRNIKIYIINILNFYPFYFLFFSITCFFFFFRSQILVVFTSCMFSLTSQTSFPFRILYLICKPIFNFDRNASVSFSRLKQGHKATIFFYISKEIWHAFWLVQNSTAMLFRESCSPTCYQ